MSEHDTWLWEETYGTVMPVTEATMKAYAETVLQIVGADGNITDKEWHVILGRAAALGVPEAARQQWKQYDFRKGDLTASVRALYEAAGAQANLSFFYDAIKAASADGYHEAERAAVRRAAAALEVREAQIRQIEALVEMEASLRSMRIAVLFPNPTKFHRG
jgi:uncharacterized tellurite resistance protein B-like protein